MSEELTRYGVQAIPMSDDLAEASEQASKNGVAVMRFQDGSCGIIRPLEQNRRADDEMANLLEP